MMLDTRETVLLGGNGSAKQAGAMLSVQGSTHHVRENGLIDGNVKSLQGLNSVALLLFSPRLSED